MRSTEPRSSWSSAAILPASWALAEAGRTGNPRAGRRRDRTGRVYSSLTILLALAMAFLALHASERLRTLAITSGALVILLVLAVLMLGGNWPRATLRGHVGPVYAIAFSPDGSTLASQGADRTVRLWDVGSGTTRAVIPESKKPDWFHGNPRLSPDGKLVAGLVTEKGDWRFTRLTLTDPISGET